jgi:hypothetical protein
MSLQMICVEGRFRPVVVCDHCGEQIADAKDGNYEWRMREDGQIEDGQIYFTHKACCRPFEIANGGRVHWFAIGLECLPVYLATNLERDWAKAKKTAALMSQMG